MKRIENFHKSLQFDRSDVKRIMKAQQTGIINTFTLTTMSTLNSRRDPNVCLWCGKIQSIDHDCKSKPDYNCWFTFGEEGEGVAFVRVSSYGLRGVEEEILQDEALDFSAYNLFTEMSEPTLSSNQNQNVALVDESTIVYENDEVEPCESSVDMAESASPFLEQAIERDFQENSYALISASVDIAQSLDDENKLCGESFSPKYMLFHQVSIKTYLVNLVKNVVLPLILDDMKWFMESDLSMILYLEVNNKRLFALENVQRTFLNFKEVHSWGFDPVVGWPHMNLSVGEPDFMPCLDSDHILVVERMISEECIWESVDFFCFDPGGLWACDLWDDDDGLLHELSLLSGISNFRFDVLVLAYLAGNVLSDMGIEVLIFILTLEDKGDFMGNGMVMFSGVHIAKADTDALEAFANFSSIVPLITGAVLDLVKCNKLTMEGRHEIVYELGKWRHGAIEKLLSWSCQKSSKRSRKPDNPSRLLVSASTTNISSCITDSNSVTSKCCKNVALKVRLNNEDLFCKRCTCYICHNDDNKDFSIWLTSVTCNSEPPFPGDSCNMSCHLECALKHRRSGVARDEVFTQLYGVFYCISSGKMNELIEMLQSPNLQLKKLAALAPGRLVQEAHNQAGIVYSGGLVPLLKLLDSRNGSLQHNFAFALYGLANNEDNIADFIKLGGFQVLQEAEFIVQATRPLLLKYSVHIYTPTIFVFDPGGYDSEPTMTKRPQVYPYGAQQQKFRRREDYQSYVFDPGGSLVLQGYKSVMLCGMEGVMSCILEDKDNFKGSVMIQTKIVRRGTLVILSYLLLLLASI